MEGAEPASNATARSNVQETQVSESHDEGHAEAVIHAELNAAVQDSEMAAEIEDDGRFCSLRLAEPIA